MHTHTSQKEENKNQLVASSSSQRRGGEFTLQFVDNRPEAVAQRKLQEMVNSGLKISQLVKLSKIPRPAFIGPVKHMRTDAQGLHPGTTIHMAHRMSWQEIESIVRGGNKTQINQIMNLLTIPQRNFGDPANGGVQAGNQDYYKAVQHVVFQYGLVSPQLAKALNSSPYNLRPGHGPTNSAIGGGSDAHFDETQLGEPMTPQSKALLPPGTQDSSDFMTMDAFQEWEANFYNDYVKPAILSALKI